MKDTLGELPDDVEADCAPGMTILPEKLPILKNGFKVTDQIRDESSKRMTLATMATEHGRMPQENDESDAEDNNAVNLYDSINLVNDDGGLSGCLENLNIEDSKEISCEKSSLESRGPNSGRAKKTVYGNILPDVQEADYLQGGKRKNIDAMYPPYKFDRPGDITNFSQNITCITGLSGGSVSVTSPQTDFSNISFGGNDLNGGMLSPSALTDPSTEPLHNYPVSTGVNSCHNYPSKYTISPLPKHLQKDDRTKSLESFVDSDFESAAEYSPYSDSANSPQSYTNYSPGSVTSDDSGVMSIGSKSPRSEAGYRNIPSVESSMSSSPPKYGKSPPHDINMLSNTSFQDSSIPMYQFQQPQNVYMPQVSLGGVPQLAVTDRYPVTSHQMTMNTNSLLQTNSGQYCGPVNTPAVNIIRQGPLSQNRLNNLNNLGNMQMSGIPVTSAGSQIRQVQVSSQPMGSVIPVDSLNVMSATSMGNTQNTQISATPVRTQPQINFQTGAQMQHPQFGQLQISQPNGSLGTLPVKTGLSMANPYPMMNGTQIDSKAGILPGANFPGNSTVESWLNNGQVTTAPLTAPIKTEDRRPQGQAPPSQTTPSFDDKELADVLAVLADDLKSMEDQKINKKHVNHLVNPPYCPNISDVPAQQKPQIPVAPLATTPPFQAQTAVTKPSPLVPIPPLSQFVLSPPSIPGSSPAQLLLLPNSGTSPSSFIIVQNPEQKQLPKVNRQRRILPKVHDMSTKETAPPPSTGTVGVQPKQQDQKIAGKPQSTATTKPTRTSGPEPSGPLSGNCANKLNHARRIVADLNRNHIMYRDEDGDTYLHVAVCQTDSNMIQALLERISRELLQSMIDEKNSRQQTPLYLAVATNAPKMVSLFIKYRADVNIPAQETSSDGTSNLTTYAIHLAASRGESHQETLKQLLRAPNININQVNSTGQTALHCAILAHRKLNGNVIIDSRPIVALLLAAGADPNSQDMRSGKTPLMYAIETKDYDLVETMIKLFEPSKLRHIIKSQTFDGCTCLKITEGLKGSFEKNTWEKLWKLLYTSANT
ncbi:hypothetical protein ScPMuIL_003000 [Solemya velum]